MTENSMKPRIRFKGYTDAWEQRKFSYYFDERNERSGNGELISVTVGSGIKKFSELGRHDTKPDDMSNYKCVVEGDIAYNSMRMWQGASGYSPYTGILSPAYTVITPKYGVSAVFFSYLLKLAHMIHLFEINSQGLTSDTWNLKYPAFSKIEATAPVSSKEQDKIASLFVNLDNLITLHQRKYDKIVNIKKALLEKMFPADSETTPQIRFKGFTDAWEQRKLGGVTNIQKGQQLGKAEMSVVGTFYVLNGGMDPSGYTDQYNTPANTISISEGGNSCGYVSLNLERFWSGGHNYTLQNLKIDTIFLYQWLKKCEKVIMALRVGSGLPNIQKSSLKAVDVAYPTTAEQYAIASILIKMDNLITLHQQQLEKLKNIKSALLEKMFV